MRVEIPFVNLAEGELTPQLMNYYRDMTVAFASVRRWSPGHELALVTNATPPRQVRTYLDALNVQVKIVPFKHLPPENYTKSFRTSMYFLDALDAAQGTTLFLDPDVICIRPLDDLLLTVGDTVGALPIPEKPEHEINGLTRVEAGRLHALLGEQAHVPVHYGGEFYFVPDHHLASLRERVEGAWRLGLERHARGLSRFTTEEHVMSYALRGVPITPMDEHVRRIWTARGYRTVNGNERSLTIWHVPAEKHRGILTLFAPATDMSSWWWTADRDEFVSHVARATKVELSAWGKMASVMLAPGMRGARALRLRARQLRAG